MFIVRNKGIYTLTGKIEGFNFSIPLKKSRRTSKCLKGRANISKIGIISESLIGNYSVTHISAFIYFYNFSYLKELYFS